MYSNYTRFFIIFSLLLVSVNEGFAKENQKKKLVKRRVLLVDFVNQKDSANQAYLSVSIPEALVESLKETRTFEVVNRSTAQSTVKRLNIQAKDTFNEDKAISIGKAARAEVVVIGTFVTIGNNIQIRAKAVDVLAGRIAVSKTKTGKLDSSIFKTINQLAKSISNEMKEKLPPLPKRVIIKERVVFREKNNNSESPKGSGYLTHLLIGSAFTIGSESDFLKPTIGASLDVSFHLFSFINPFFQGSFMTAKGQQHINNMTFMQAAGGITYPIELGFITISPYTAMGISTGKIESSTTERNYLRPLITFGLINDYAFTKRLGISLAIMGNYLVEKDSPLFLAGASLGVYFKL